MAQKSPNTPEIPVTDNIRKALYAWRRVNTVKSQLSRAEMALTKVTDSLGVRELEIYHRHIGKTPDKRFLRGNWTKLQQEKQSV